MHNLEFLILRGAARTMFCIVLYPLVKVKVPGGRDVVVV